MTKSYVALLRGINVGGRNIIRMVDLVGSFEKMGFEDVSTYIQSGNVLFSASGSLKELELKIERGLSKDYGYSSTVVVISGEKFKEVVDKAPKGFGGQPDVYKYDVIFLKPPLKSEKAVEQVSVREGVDMVVMGSGVLYFSRLSEQLGKSYLSKLVKSAVYKQVTIRNWNTTTKLVSLLPKRV